MTLPAKIIAQKNVLDTKFPWLNLVEVQFNDAEDRVKRFVRNYEDLYWLSEKYWDTGCVAHWKMNDNAADHVIADSSGNNLNGTSQVNTNTMTVAGKINTALEFDGAVDYGRVADNALLNFGTGDFAASFWMKTTTAGEMRFLNKGISGQGWEIYIMAGKNCPGCFVGDDAEVSSYGNFISYTGNLRDGSWHHIVLNFDRDGNVTPYIDNVAYTGFSISLSSGSVSNLQDFAIGIFDDWVSTKYTGYLDDIRLYNRLLTLDEIKLLYNTGNGTEKVPALYESFNFSCSLIQENSEGELPKTTLTVSNVTQFLQEFLEETEGLVDSTILFTIIHADNLGEDYAELQTMFEVLASRITAMDVIFDVGGMSLLRQRYPLHRYFADLCRHRFENARCQYQRKTVVSVTLSGTDPVSIQVTAHTFSTGDGIRLAGIAGITPSLDGTYIITKIDANNFTLNGTNSSNYAGTYTNGGTAGYSVCGRRLVDCRQRTNSPHFGAFPGLESGTVRIA